MIELMIELKIGINNNIYLFFCMQKLEFSDQTEKIIHLLDQMKKLPDLDSIEINVKMHAHLSGCMARRVLYRIIYMPEHLEKFKFPRELFYAIQFNNLNELVEFINLDKKTYYSIPDYVNEDSFEEFIGDSDETNRFYFRDEFDDNQQFSLWKRIIINYNYDEIKIIFDRNINKITAKFSCDNSKIQTDEINNILLLCDDVIYEN